jgi:hypothetical protein
MLKSLALRTRDFIGWTQFPFPVVMKRSLTFINPSSKWLSFLPCSFMAMVFFDLVPRDVRTPAEIKRERALSPNFTIVGPTLCSISIGSCVIVGIFKEFDSTAIASLGGVYGTIAALLWFVRDLPQISI